jgi:hypothetical protein
LAQPAAQCDGEDRDTLVTHPNKSFAPTIEDYAEACTAPYARTAKARVNRNGLMLQLEPGRAMHGNTGVHLTTVRNLKRMSSPIRYHVIVVDTTEFWFTGGRYEHHLHDYVFANKVMRRRSRKPTSSGAAAMVTACILSCRSRRWKWVTCSPCSTRARIRKFR